MTEQERAAPEIGYSLRCTPHWRDCPAPVVSTRPHPSFLSTATAHPNRGCSRAVSLVATVRPPTVCRPGRVSLTVSRLSMSATHRLRGKFGI
jgi:hypothetical protein